jgi:hypothetical protein
MKGRNERAEDEGMIADDLGRSGGLCLGIVFVSMLVLSRLYKKWRGG